MKAMFIKLLRALQIDTLLLGLIEKLALGLIKKLSALANAARGYLNRIQQEHSPCSCE